MTVTIDLRPEIEAGLATLAAEQGVSLAQYVRRLLEDQVPGQATLSPRERESAWRDSVKDLPRTQPLSDEAISRESIYDAMSVLVDTNVLLRRVQPDHPSHTVAVESVARLLATGEPVYFVAQNIAEFWNVATRPAANNGLGFSVALTLSEVGNIERALTLLPDSPAIYAEWKRLVVEHNVLGSKVHDTRLVAAMNVHGVKALNPASLLS